MAIYKVIPASGEPEYTVEADSYEFDPDTGRHTLKDGVELVATLINVSVVKQPDA